MSNLNTFSQEKVLRYYTEIQNYLKTGNIIKPAVVDIDLSGYCMANCYFCNASRVHNKKFLSLQDVSIITTQLNAMNLKNLCIAGGGEPLANPDFIKIQDHFNENNFKRLLTTNGVLLKKLVHELYNYVSIGVSIDYINRETYCKTRGYDYFDDVIEGLTKLNKYKKNNKIKDTTAKVLITKYNYNILYKIANFVKSIGFDNLYLRPVGLHNIYSSNGNIKDLTNYKLTNDETKIAKDELCRITELQDNSFFVHYSNQFKDDITTPKYEFKKCIATMFCTVFSTDGYVYLCMDNRGNPFFRLCKHEEYSSAFNSKKHKDIIENIKIEKCPRCIKNTTNKIIEKYIINDEINIDFI